jgi:hypothetical protein
VRPERVGEDEPFLAPAFAHAWTLAIVLLAAWLSLRGLGDTFLIGDELHSLRQLELGFGEIACTYDRFGSGLALPLLQKAAALALGHDPLVYRLPAVLGALGTLLLAGPVARRLFGEPAAWLAGAALATSAIHVFYSRYARSYSLGACLALFFVLALLRVLEGSPARRRWLAGVALAGGLLPAVHLSTASFLLATGLAALWNARGTGHARALFVTLVSGALLACLLHLPAWSDLGEFLGAKLLEGPPEPFGPPEVATVLAGSRAAGWILLVALPIAALAFARRAGVRSALAVAGPLGLGVGLVVSRPPGLAFAYARYLFTAWPLCLMLVAWAWCELVRCLPLARRRAELVALVTGLLWILGAFLASPLGPGRIRDGRFANSNLALQPAPAFDAPWKNPSGFYSILAGIEGPVRIVEFPALRTRNLLLYRNHWLRHQKEVLLGHREDAELARLARGPYLDLADVTSLARHGVDYLVVHHNIDAELANYWTFVQDEVWPSVRQPGDEAAMAALSTFGILEGNGRAVPAFERALRRELGPPSYEDATVRVWEPGR